MQDGPVTEVLDGIVRAVVAAPALDAFEVAAVVEVMVEELLTRPRVRAEELASSRAQGVGVIGLSTRITVS